MKPRLTAFLFAFLLFSKFSFAQAPFPTIDSVDINNIKATVLVHGDLWWNPGTQNGGCSFPKNSNTDIASAGSLWMSGYDAGNVLHVAAQTYRQKGNDYWPGPLNNTGTLSYSTSQIWAKIWKVNRTQIDSFKAISIHTTTNTPAPILQWPAKGNPYATGNGGVSLTITSDMAPFVDANNDGIYDPLQGDYPAIKGDQSLWWIFSDCGPQHNETGGQPLQVEIHAMAYAYKRGTMIDNVIYYEYDLTNKSTNNYTNFRVGQWDDANLGYGADDYIGFDSTHRMGITYNGSPVDGNGTTYGYGNMIPAVGLTMLTLPGDAAPNYAPAGSFMYYNNTPNFIFGNPASALQYDGLLRSRWGDNTHLTDDFMGYGQQSRGYGNTYPECNYVYPGDPGDTAQWSECASGNPLDDRRFVIASNDFTFAAGSSQKVALALLTTNPMLNNGCPSTNFSAIEALADTVWAVYQNPLPVLIVANVQPVNNLYIYPNPTHDKLFIDNLQTGTSMVVYNMLGQVMQIPVSINAGSTQLNVAGLPSGVYNILYSKNGVCGTARFVKD